MIFPMINPNIAPGQRKYTIPRTPKNQRSIFEKEKFYKAPKIGISPIYEIPYL
jgi:hypothetical protein